MRLLKFRKKSKDPQLEKSGKPFKGLKDFNVNKNWTMFIVAILLGVSGIYLANSFIDGQIAEHEAKIREGQELVKAVVPKVDLPRGVRISASDLSIREIPKTFLHSGIVTPENFSLAEGQRLSFPVDGGKPLLWAHLEAGSVPTFSGKLPEGMRAITVPVDEINSISGMLQPKDKIDLLLTFSPYGDKKVTLPLLQDVLVLATGTQITTEKYSDDSGRIGSKTYDTVTLQVLPLDAKRVVLAQASGHITAALRHPDDNELDKSGRTTVASLLTTEKRKFQGVQYIIGGTK